MNKEKMQMLKHKLCEELEVIASKDITGANLETIQKLSSAIKNLCKIMEGDEGEYSQSRSYQDGYSGRHYVRGHYSQDGMSRRSYGGGSYEGGSYEGGSYGDNSYGSMESQAVSKRHMIEELEEAMASAESSRERERIRKLIEELSR